MKTTSLTIPILVLLCATDPTCFGAEVNHTPLFPDALGRIEATFDAAPGRESTRNWIPSAKGSVRLVGKLRKLSQNAAAKLEVMAAGKPVWSRSLAKADTLHHGLDILVCDLEAKSPIVLRVSANDMPARVAVDLEVVPEPYVSRWDAGLPNGYPSWNEDQRKALRQKGQDILKTIREASAKRLGKLVIPPGDYLFHARWSQASTLPDLADLEIVAQGVTFWFEPPMVHALLFERCRNVTVRGLTIDFTEPCWFQARVTEVDRKAKTIRAAIMPGYEPRNADGKPETKGRRALMFYDAQGRFINHRHSPGSWQLSEDGKEITCRDIEVSGIPAALKPGDHVVGTIRTGAALRSVQCAGMRFEDVNIWSSPGMAVNEGGGAGGHVYHRVRATRRPHTNRLQAFGADIFHLAGADRGPTLDRCELAYGADDNLNIHGSFGRVVERVDKQRYFLQGAYEPGDTIEFRDQKSVDLLGKAKVLSVTAAPDGPSLPIGKDHTAKGESLVLLDTPLELPPLSLVVLDGKRSAEGFVLRDCWLHDNFQRTLINGSPRGLIENNTLQNVGQGLMIQFETWGPWMEGPFARDLVIRGNRFLDAPPDGTAINVSMHPPGGGSNHRRFQAKPVTNLTITGNFFARSSAVPINIHNVDGLTIHSNNIDYPADQPLRTGLANSSPVHWLYLQDCENVSLEDNQTQKGKWENH